MQDLPTIYLVLGAGYVLLLTALLIMTFARLLELSHQLEELRRGYRALIARLPSAAPASPSPSLAPSLAPSPAPVEPITVAASSPLPPTPSIAPPPAPRRTTVEQLLGGRLLAWVGAVAVTVAGIFLVKYSIDQGWLGPLARVVLTAALGGVFIAVGELLQRRDAPIAQAVAAAGVAVLYVALFAAVALYGLLSSDLGTVLALLLSALGLALSWRLGPIVALVALVGGGIAPAILAPPRADALGLFAYLLPLLAGVTALMRARGWGWLGWCALAAALLWAALWLGLGYDPGGAIWLGIFLLAMAALLFSLVPATSDLRWTTLSSLSVLAAFLVGRSAFALFPWVVLLALGALSFWQARRQPRWQWVALLPVLLSALVFVYWGQLLVPAIEAVRYATTALLVAGLISTGAYALLWRAARPGWWAAVAVGNAVLHFAIVCTVLFRFDLGMGWGYVSLLLALPFVLAALPVARLRDLMAGADEALGVLALGAIVFVSAAVPLQLHREWITMSYAIELPLVAYVAWRLELPLLRVLAWLLTATVTIRLVFNPYVLDYDVSGSPLLNWVLYGYGVAIVCYTIAARLLKRVGRPSLDPAADHGTGHWPPEWSDTWLVRVIQASTVAFAFLLLTLEVRSVFHPEGLGSSILAIRSAELYAYSIVWLLLGAALLVGGIVQRSTVLRYASLVVLVLVVAKVFAIDMAGLVGLLRVASFLGLGIALLALGFVYRRYVFRDELQTEVSRGQ